VELVRRPDQDGGVGELLGRGGRYAPHGEEDVREGLLLLLWHVVVVIDIRIVRQEEGGIACQLRGQFSRGCDDQDRPPPLPFFLVTGTRQRGQKVRQRLSAPGGGDQQQVLTVLGERRGTLLDGRGGDVPVVGEDGGELWIVVGERGCGCCGFSSCRFRGWRW